MSRADLFKSNLTYEPDILILLGALERYRKATALSKVRVVASAVFASLADEFAYRGIEVVSEGTAAFDLDAALRTCRASDTLEEAVLGQLLRLPEPDPPSTLSGRQTLIFRRHTHLGDALAILSGLHAYVVANHIDDIRVSGGAAFTALFKTFQFPRIEFIDGDDGGNLEVEGCFTRASWRIPWLTRFACALHARYGGRLPDPAMPPPLRREARRDVAQENFILCQFDSRSHTLPPLKTTLSIINRLVPGADVRAIGGADTVPYLGTDFRYELGNLPFIVDRLRACRLFLGYDSGIAHVAGALGVPSVVINLSDFESVQIFFRSYPNTIVVDRRLFECLDVRLVTNGSSGSAVEVPGW